MRSRGKMLLLGLSALRCGARSGLAADEPAPAAPCERDPAADESWKVETVDETGISGNYVSLAIDQDGDAWISHQDYGAHDLRFATNAGGAWLLESVEEQGSTGWETSLAIGADRVAHIAFLSALEDGGLELRHAHGGPGRWTVEAVVSEPPTDGLSLALAPGDVPAIAYVAQGSYDVRLATLMGDAWRHDVLAGGYDPALAFDSSGAAHLTFYDAAGWQRYGTNARGSWLFEIIDAGHGQAGGRGALALGASGAVHVAYRDQDGRLRWASNEAGGWTATTVDGEGNTGHGLSIALAPDGADTVHLSYYRVAIEHAGFELRHATRDAEGAWHVEVVDEGPAGAFSSIAVDAQSSVHIAYYGGESVLRYARRGIGACLDPDLER